MNISSPNFFFEIPKRILKRLQIGCLQESWHFIVVSGGCCCHVTRGLGSACRVMFGEAQPVTLGRANSSSVSHCKASLGQISVGVGVTRTRGRGQGSGRCSHNPATTPRPCLVSASCEGGQEGASALTPPLWEQGDWPRR